jgi:hypothetical protein
MDDTHHLASSMGIKILPILIKRKGVMLGNLYAGG